jgi:hypothetical protein
MSWSRWTSRRRSARRRGPKVRRSRSRPGRGRDRERDGEAISLSRRARRRAPRRCKRSATPTGSCSGRARGSAASSHTCWSRARGRAAPDAGAAAGRSQPGSAAGRDRGFSPQTHLEVLGRHAPGLAIDVVLVDPSTAPDLVALEKVAAGFGPGWSSRRSPGPTVPHVTTPSCSPLRTTTSFLVAGSSPMAMTAAVKDELAHLVVTRRAAARPRCPRCCVSPAGCTSSAAHRGRGGARHRCDRAAAAQGHRRGLRARRDVTWSRRVGCARAAATSCAWSGTARRWPGRPACSTAAASGRGLPPQVVRRRLRRGGGLAGAFLAHGSLTEPGRSSALEITCPGPEAALALVGAAAGCGISAKAREVRGVDRVVDPRRRRDRRAADPSRRPRQRAGLGGAPDAPRGPGHRQPAGQLRRRQHAPVGAGRRRRRRPGAARAGDPRRRHPDHLAAGRRAAARHKQASLEELGRWPTRR